MISDFLREFDVFSRDFETPVRELRNSRKKLPQDSFVLRFVNSRKTDPEGEGRSADPYRDIQAVVRDPHETFGRCDDVLGTTHE